MVAGSNRGIGRSRKVGTCAEAAELLAGHLYHEQFRKIFVHRRLNRLRRDKRVTFPRSLDPPRSERIGSNGLRVSMPIAQVRRSEVRRAHPAPSDW